MALSAKVQEYLAEAYRIAYYQDGDRRVSNADLAEVMHVTDAAISRMIKRLAREGYVQHHKHRGIVLTEKGEREALAHIRRHRLVERFLVDVMGFGWHEVHDSADGLGATISDVVVNRMDEMAGFPRRCPHGEPIPTAEGDMPRIHDYPLTEVEANSDDVWVVSRVNTHDSDMLQYIASLGLKPGATLRLIERAPFNGPLQLEVDGEVRVIGHELGGVLRVCSREEFELV